MKELDQVEEGLAHCKGCYLHRTRKNIVFSRGNPRAKIMLVGEGPGENEDEEGVPFVGRSGRLLDKMLTAVDLNPLQDVYITNVVKCRPPGNREPVLEEMEACSHVLRAQVGCMKPMFIVTLGNVPLHFFLKTKDVRISDIRGDYLFLEKWGTIMVPLFHPSYLLRQPSRDYGSPKWRTWQDLKELKHRLDLYEQGELEHATEITNDMWT